MKFYSAVTQCHSEGGGEQELALNFEIVGGLEKPETPTKNTIWIKSEKEVFEVWEFSSTEPATPQEYMLWLKTSSVSSAAFNAADENKLMVYPTSAHVYNGGSWTTISDAQIYVDEAWRGLSQYLFLSGNQFGEVTGGWSTSGTGITVPIGQSLKIDWYTTGTPTAIIYTTNKIDLTNRKTLWVKGKLYTISDANYGNAVFGVTNAPSATLGGMVTYNRVNNGNVYGTYSLDVSALNGSYYIQIMCNKPNATGTSVTFTVDVSDVWLE